MIIYVATNSRSHTIFSCSSSQLAWKNDTVGAVVMTVGVLFVANPIVFVFCRAVSRILPRRLLDNSEMQLSYKRQSFDNDEEAVVVY